MQRTKSKTLSILLSLVMLLSLLPTTALAADSYPAANMVSVDDGKEFAEPGCYYFKNGASACSKDSSGSNATYNPATGTLTLNGYNGGSITAGDTGAKVTVDLVGDNYINDGSLVGSWGSDITVTSSSGGTLTITNILNDSNAAIGIQAGYGNIPTGNVTITGNAQVKIDMTHTGTSGSDVAYGIFARENITISENASVDIICKTPSNTASLGSYCNGLYAAKDVTIETDGKIKINVTTAGDSGTQSFGIYPMGNSILTKVKEMEVWWKSHDTHPSYPGGAIKGGGSFDTNTHAVNVDETKCYASYRFGTPYTVTVENGTLAGTGVVSHANNNGNFLAGDTVEIKPSVMKGKSGEVIPFKEWTPSDVAFTSPATTENNSFTVPANAVTVTAKHNPFDGKPTFMPTGTTGTDGTLTFKTKVKPDGGNEYFRLVKEADKDDESKYNTVLNPNNSPTTSPYEYSYAATSGSSPSQIEPGDYYVAERLSGAWYLSEKFTVNYAAAPTPTANISLDKTGTVDFGSVEAGYTAAPAAQTVTITNNGTAATGPLTIALDGTNFELNKTSISDITDGNSDTFTVQPKTGLPAGIYTATVKVSGTGVTEQSFTVKFTVTAPATSIAVPAANTGLVYDGTKQTGVNAGTGYTLGGVYEATDVGAVDYTATATLKTGYKWDDNTTGVKTITWNIGKRTPTAADFIFAPPTDLTYDGNNKTASVTLNSPLTKSGAITRTYMKDGSVVTATKDVGTYTVKIDVAGGDNFDAGSGLTDTAWTFAITPANQNAPTGLGVAVPTTSGGNGKITGTTTAMEYNADATATSGWTACSATETEVAPGTYYVRLKAVANHNAGTVSAPLVVPAYSATKYTVTVTSDANGTASADKTINVAAGETVTLTATPQTGYVFDKWDNKTPASLTIDTDGKFTMPSGNVSVKATFKPAALTGTASITGTLKYGQELTATLTGGNNTGNLDYKWYQNGTTQVAANNTGKYTLSADDIGKTITVKITSSVQTGEITSAATATVAKADGPAAPSVTPVACTNSSNNDGKLQNVTNAMEYQKSGAGTWTACSGTEVSNLTPGTYLVRVKATGTTLASDSQSVVIAAYVAPTEYTITFNVNGGSGTIPSQTTSGKKLSSLPTAIHSGSYSFDGWYTAASGGTQITTAYTFSADTTVYAHWTYTGGGGGGSYYAPVVPDMPMLYRGCTGDAVKTLQDKLNTLGYNSGNVDGIFGAKTYAAVTAFQKANSLGVDGIVGKLTWGKLYGISPAMPVETTVVGRPMVSYGSRGDAVRKLQELLNALGYDCGSVDGIFGSKTKAAVLVFQKANGLAADGIVGPLTWGKLV